MTNVTFGEAIRDAVRYEMNRDPDIFVAGEDVQYGGAYTEFLGFADEFPDRIIPTPISETAIMGLGLGSAALRLRPLLCMSKIDFMMVAFDEVINQASKFRYMFGGKVELPMVMQANYGMTLRGQAAQHSQSLEALFCHMPGIKVVAPSTHADAKGLMIAALRDNNPVLYMQPMRLMQARGDAPDGEYIVPIGKASIRREGSDLTIVSWGPVCCEAVLAAETLEKEGIHAEVVDLRTLSPIDKDTILNSVAKTSRLLIAHEAVKQAGLGAEIAAIVAEEGMDYLDAPIKRLGGPFAPIPFSPVLEAGYFISADKIADAAREMF